MITPIPSVKPTVFDGLSQEETAYLDILTQRKYAHPLVHLPYAMSLTEDVSEHIFMKLFLTDVAYLRSRVEVKLEKQRTLLKQQSFYQHEMLEDVRKYMSAVPNAFHPGSTAESVKADLLRGTQNAVKSLDALLEDPLHNLQYAHHVIDQSAIELSVHKKRRVQIVTLDNYSKLKDRDVVTLIAIADSYRRPSERITTLLAPYR
jgi:hypothetical protein